jgi:hypothetical protein
MVCNNLTCAARAGWEQSLVVWPRVVVLVVPLILNYVSIWALTNLGIS